MVTPRACFETGGSGTLSDIKPEATVPDIVSLLIAAAIFSLFFIHVTVCAKI